MIIPSSMRLVAEVEEDEREGYWLVRLCNLEDPDAHRVEPPLVVNRLTPALLHVESYYPDASITWDVSCDRDGNTTILGYLP